MPIKYFHQRSKNCWNKELKELRKETIKKHKILKSDKDDAFCMAEYKHARNTYFSAIKPAKQGHWNNFLEKKDPRSIFWAMSYTKEATTKIIPSLSRDDGNMEVSFEGKCRAFRTTLFSTPPVNKSTEWDGYQAGHWRWPRLKPSELEKACSSTIKGKTLGPDEITQETII